MCTVVGYIGKSLCSTFIFEGLARLEYRGYDAAGFACLEPINKKLLYSKASGQLSQLTDRLIFLLLARIYLLSTGRYLSRSIIVFAAMPEEFII